MVTHKRTHTISEKLTQKDTSYHRNGKMVSKKEDMHTVTEIITRKENIHFVLS
jgi:hypothetical protein